MSITISISSYSNKCNAAYIFKDIYTEFSVYTNDIEIMREKWLTKEEVKLLKYNNIGLTSWESGNKQQALLNIGHEIDNQLDQIIKSDEKIIANIPYHVNDDYLIGIDLEIYGELYENGFAVSNDGFIRATFGYNDMQSPMISILKNTNDFSSEELTHDEKFRLAVKSCNDAYETIFQIMSLANSSIQHCFGYLETGVPLPIFCNSLFHSNIQDFIIDFWRIYIGFNYEIKPLELYEINDERAFLDLLNELKPNDRNNYYYKSLIDTFPEAIHFIKEINIDKVKYMSGLTNFEVKELLETTKNYFDNDILNLNIEIKKTRNSFTIFGIPNGNIWKFYEAFYNFV